MRVCGDCGRPLEAWESSCSACQIESLQLDKASAEAPLAPPARSLEERPISAEPSFDPKLFEKAPSDLRLDKTYSLEEEAVLVVRQPRQVPRTFVMEPGKTVAVGRDASVNTITIDDRTVSAQHFRIVPRELELWVLDLGSTNGTLVNGERVRVHRLKPGDVIASGDVEIEYRQQYVRSAPLAT